MNGIPVCNMNQEIVVIEVRNTLPRDRSSKAEFLRLSFEVLITIRVLQELNSYKLKKISLLKSS